MVRNYGLLLCLLIGGVSAEVCDAVYYLQGGTQYLREGRLAATETVLNEAVSTVYSNMAGVTIIDTNTHYSVVKQLQGVCGVPVKNPVVYLSRPTGSQTSFSENTRNDLFCFCFDTLFDVILSNSGFRQYYGIGPDTSNGLVSLIPGVWIAGRADTSRPFVTWYGAVSLVDSTYGSGRWSVTTRYYQELNDYYDSTGLENGLMYDFRTPYVWNGTTKIGHYRLQLLKLGYDSTQAAVSRFPRTAATGSARLDLGSADVRGVFDPSGRMVARGRRTTALEARPLAAGVYLVRLRSDVRTRRVTAVGRE